MKHHKNLQFAANSLIAAFAAISPMLPAEAQCGMVDAYGNTILPYKYSTIEDAGNGRYVARELVPGNNQAEGPNVYHLFDAHGNEFPFDERLIDKLNLLSSQPKNLPSNLSARHSLSSKFFIVHNNEGLTGVYDRDGKMILPCKYVQVREVEKEKFVAKDYLYSQFPDKLFNADGKLLFEFKDWSGDSCQGYSCGLMRLVDNKTGKVGFVDENGKTVIEPGKYDTEFGFGENLCAVKIHSAGSEDSGFIDQTGKLVIGPIKDSVAMPFQDGLAVIQRKAGDEIVCGAVDRQGKFVLPMEYSRVANLGKGFIYASKTKVSRVEVFDNEGKSLLRLLPPGATPQWGSQFDFGKEGLIPVSMKVTNATNKSGMLSGYCDKQGKIVIKPQFEHAFPFVGDFAAIIVENDGERRMGAIDKAGKIVIPTTNKILVVFPEGRFAVWPAPASGDLVSRWKNPSHLGDRLLIETLKKYDLIGMKFTDIQKIMGEGYAFEPKQDLPRNICKRRRYMLSGPSSCANARQDFELGFDKDDVVVGWNLCNFCGSGYWIFENVVWLDTDSRLDTRFLVPKSHAEAISKFK